MGPRCEAWARPRIHGAPVDLYLVRHAIAEPRDAMQWPDDSRRPLTPAGAARMRSAACGLRRLAVVPEGVLVSPFVRAVSTAEILDELADWPAAELRSELEPSCPASAGLRLLAAREETSLALVGHEPQLSRLASLLLSGHERSLEIELKKGGVICLDAPSRLAPGAGRLRWSASPRMLRRVGR